MRKIKNMVAALLLVTVVLPFARAVDGGKTQITFIPNFGAGASETDNTEPKVIEVESVVQDGRTLVPIRDVAEAMGATVVWQNSERSIGIWRTIPVYDEWTATGKIVDETTYSVHLSIGNSIMFYSDETHSYSEVELEVAPQLINQRTMLPLRAVCEYLNCKVEWWGSGSIGVYPLAYEVNEPLYEGGYARGNFNAYMNPQGVNAPKTITFSKYGFTMEIPANWYDTHTQNKNGTSYFSAIEYGYNCSILFSHETTSNRIDKTDFLETYFSTTKSFLLTEKRQTTSGISYMYIKLTSSTVSPDRGYEYAIFDTDTGLMSVVLQAEIDTIDSLNYFNKIVNSITKQ